MINRVKKINKIKLIGSGIAGVIFFLYISISIIHMTKVNGTIDKWSKSYKEIEEDFSAFTRVSDPRTIRSYVEQLEDILDNITFLGRMVESGQLADEALTQILDEQSEINKKMLDMVTLSKHNELETQLRIQSSKMMEDGDRDLKLIDSLDAEIELLDSNIMNKIDNIQKEINEIKTILGSMNKKKFFHTHK